MRRIHLAVGMVALMAMLSVPALAQERERGERRGFDREAMQERMLNAMLDGMGVEDAEERSVVQPRLARVMQLRQQEATAGLGMGMGMMARGARGDRGRGGDREGRPGARRGGDDGERSERRARRGGDDDERAARRRGGRGGDDVDNDIRRTTRYLQQMLRDEDADADAIAEAVAAVREARAEHQAELRDAQAELVEVLTPRQEARLVAGGLLD